ncbi:hypothetical protein [Enterococcus sp. AZ109]|uniref:hypothetical protein n=1 Tax=Enterococcus sp. AZ109 TaxID=2774634 RepID=UPI003F279931
MDRSSNERQAAINNQDLHDILEAINAKQESDAALKELSRNLAVFKESLIYNGFSNFEALYLTAQWMETMFKMKPGGMQ